MRENPLRDALTNETIKGLFKNNFLLVNRAINLARFYMRAGHEVKMVKLLQELKNNPGEDYLQELQELEEAETENESFDQEQE
ncbi:MAG TPA: hypothetical protein VGJ00_05410 [Rhabdochlamydiaceae bacterium]|jgi:hypothetical protein